MEILKILKSAETVQFMLETARRDLVALGLESEFANANTDKVEWYHQIYQFLCYTLLDS